MLGVTDLPTYLAGLVLIVLLPGPNSLYVLSVAARSGIRTGYKAAAGVWCGDAVLMTLSAAGVASLLQGNALLFGIVKYAGAGYLTWLAVGMLRAAWGMWRTRRVRAEAPASVTAAEERPFRRALVISLFNPKAILFFVAFFVQFVDPGYAYPALSFVVLGRLRPAGELPLPLRPDLQRYETGGGLPQPQAAVRGGHDRRRRAVPGLRGQAHARQRIAGQTRAAYSASPSAVPPAQPT